MIRVEVSRQIIGDHKVIEFTVSGHADTAPHGQDIVCAAVSAIVQTAIMGVERIAHGPSAITRPGDVRWQGVVDDVAEGIIETMLLGLQDIADQYPETVIAIAVGRVELHLPSASDAATAPP